jgi:4,5-DOPA dioxygenase extradiol
MGTGSKTSAEKMPVLFIGHGNPMNAVRDTPFTRKLHELGKRLPRPKAVLCVSAHWMTEGTWITHMRNPKTIHDFYGFPQELFDIQYPAPGDPATAEYISRDSPDAAIQPDNELWGLDHGTWAVLRHMYPAADVPVLQLSLNMIQGPEFHFALGEKLKYLRREGVLIIGPRRRNLWVTDIQSALKGSARRPGTRCEIARLRLSAVRSQLPLEPVCPLR